jgi:hypothetical protein
MSLMGSSGDGSRNGLSGQVRESDYLSVVPLVDAVGAGHAHGEMSQDIVRGTFCAALVLSAGMLCGLARAQGAEPANPAPMFPFVLPWDDATPGLVDLSGRLPKPAGKFGQVKAGEDGHLYAGTERIRFFGVDLAFGANIPTHEQAEKIAAHMAKFGINIVRFHIMDMAHFPRGILAREVKTTRDLDPEGLDRLDYFIAQLNKGGIYANLCLLNYRPINTADGLPPEIEQAGDDPYQRRHVVGFFNPQVLDLQKEYARKLLTHRNPYTGTAHAQSPGVAFVELNNENGLIHAWLGGEVDGLPPLYRAELGRQWNQWLRDRYGGTDKLRAAWAPGSQSPGNQALTNGDFSGQLAGWTLEQHAGAEADVKLSEDVPDTLRGRKSAQITISKPGKESWHIRFEQSGIRAQADRPLALEFWARADRPAPAHFSIEQLHEPWHRLSTGGDLQLTAQWQHYRIVMRINESDYPARLIFDPPMQAGVCWLAGLSLRTAGVLGLDMGERPEAGSVPTFTQAQFGERSAAPQRDWIRFLWEKEDRYWQAMFHYLKEDLKAKPLVIGTAAMCSTPNLMARMDAVDSHGYWQHPVFPGRPWDAENWYVKNIPMVNDRGGILPGLALRRVLGKPFCVTEYGHPAPNTYVSEGHLLRAAYASLQDWDYISASRYSHDSDWDLRRIRNFFDIDQHPTKMATMIPAAVMFLRGDVSAARKTVVAKLDPEQEVDLLRRGQAWDLVSGAEVGIAREAALIHEIAIATEGQHMPADSLAPGQAIVTGDRFVADTGQLDWDLREPGKGVVTVNTLRSKAVIGFGGGKRYDLGGVIIEPGATMQEGWSVITVSAMEGDFSNAPCRLLITATGDCENTRMGWKNARKSSVGRDWGEAPSLVEGIPARLTLPFAAERVSVWSLDERGERKTRLPVQTADNGHGGVVIGPQWRTIWYEIAVK